jgi:hypothetical protein
MQEQMSHSGRFQFRFHERAAFSIMLALSIRRSYPPVPQELSVRYAHPRWAAARPATNTLAIGPPTNELELLCCEHLTIEGPPQNMSRTKESHLDRLLRDFQRFRNLCGTHLP